MNLRAQSNDKKIELYHNDSAGKDFAYIAVPDSKGVVQVSQIPLSDVASLIEAAENFKKLMTATKGADVLK